MGTPTRAAGLLSGDARPRTAGPVPHRPPRGHKRSHTQTSLEKLYKADFFSQSGFLDMADRCILGKGKTFLKLRTLSSSHPSLNPVLAKWWPSRRAPCLGRRGSRAAPGGPLRGTRLFCTPVVAGRADAAAQLLGRPPSAWWTRSARAPPLDPGALGARASPAAVTFCCLL